MERESDMGSAKFTFKRYEKKYLLSREKYESLRQIRTSYRTSTLRARYAAYTTTATTTT